MCGEGMTTELPGSGINRDLLQLGVGAGKVSPRTSAWPGTHYIAQADLEFLILLTQPPDSWDDRRAA